MVWRRFWFRTDAYARLECTRVARSPLQALSGFSTSGRPIGVSGQFRDFVSGLSHLP